MRELELALKLLNTAYAAGLGTKALEEIAGNEVLLGQFLDIYREDAKIEYVERIIDCTTAPITFYRSDRDNNPKVLRHNDFGIVPWKSLKLKVWDPSRDEVPYEDRKLDEKHLLPKYLIGKPVANACICEYLRRYPHLAPRYLLPYGRAVLFWGTVYESENGKWAPGIIEPDMGLYGRRVSDWDQYYDNPAMLVEIE